MSSARSLKIAVILNPQAASGRAGRLWPRIESSIRALSSSLEVFRSERPGHVELLARQALRAGYDRIVSAGGDGTLHEVVNGFFEADTLINPEASLTLLPLGTGSDFARTLGVADAARALPLLAQAAATPVDVGRVQLRRASGEESVRYFINVADLGMGGAVIERANRSAAKPLGGFVAYLWNVLATLATYQNCRLELNIDGTVLDERCRDLIVANGQYYGGGMHVAPEACLNSGRFEVFVIKDTGPVETFCKLPKLYRGKLKGDPQVLHFSAQRIEARSEDRVLVNLDGEQPGELPVCIDLLPGALRIAMGSVRQH